MPDISMCAGEGCNKRYSCYRFTAKKRSGKLISGIEADENNCDFYWGNLEQPINKYVESFQRGHLWDYLALTNYEVHFTYFEFWRDEYFSEVEVEKIERHLIDEEYEIQENRIIIKKVI